MEEMAANMRLKKIQQQQQQSSAGTGPVIGAQVRLTNVWKIKYLLNC